ncbi:MAG: hypothetical protein JKX70_11390 [Phycisphaerales bacterium]|nr:hypothetical protein [Phycisphaerales bacterium]
MNDLRKTSPTEIASSKKSSSIAVYGSSLRDPKIGKQVHIDIMTSAVHNSGISNRIGKMIVGIDLGQTSDGFIEHVFDGMNPKDPAEEMLVSQMVLAHTRAMHLADMAMSQTNLDQIRIINEYADKAANTYRRLMLALDEYRRPRRGGDTYTQIQQANIANQQIVDNREISNEKNTTNEQGCRATINEEALPSDT